MSQADTCGNWVEPRTAAGVVERSQAMIRERANLRRRLTRIKKRFELKLKKDRPSQRHLMSDMDLAEPPMEELERLLFDLRSVFELAGDEAKIDQLDEWEEKFDEEIGSTVRDVSSFLERNSQSSTSGESTQSGGGKDERKPKVDCTAELISTSIETSSLGTEHEVLATTEMAPRQGLAAGLRDGYSRPHGVENWILDAQGQPGFGINPLFHVKPMKLPKFSGKDNEYVRWRQRFRRIIDEGQGVTDAYKLARLKEAVEGGRAQDIIDGVLDGPGAYQIAWREQETWFG